MAQLLFKRDSAGKHLKTVARHVRLCGQMPGAEKLVGLITPSYQELIKETECADNMTDSRIHAYDDLLMKDCILDNMIRTVFEKCKQFDREYPGALILVKVFPEKKISPIIYANRIKELGLAERIVLRVEMLGEKHKLFPCAKALRKKINYMKIAFEAYLQASREEDIAITKENTAKANLCKQYEINYLEARKMFGRLIAEHLFPNLKLKRGSMEEEKKNDSNIVENRAA